MRRAGLTLIEMLVVISLILALATLSVGILSRMQERQRATAAAEQLQSWIVLARQRALRDGLATGIRLAPISGMTTAASAINPNSQGVALFQLAQLGGLTGEGWTWHVVPGTLLFLRDQTPEVAVVTDVQPPHDISATCAMKHAAGVTVEVLAFARDLHFVQQPDDYHRGVGTTIEVRNEPTAGTPRVTVVDFGKTTRPGELLPGSLDSPVLPGDHLELFGGGGVHRIAAVRSRDIIEMSPFTSPPLPGQPAQLTTGDYRIRRQPRLLPGEQPLQLPRHAAIDLGRSRRLPVRVVSTGMQGEVFVEVLFAPGGGLSGASSNSLGPIFWVRDSTTDSPLDNEPVLVTIQPATGQAGAHAVATDQDPYIFARETRESGW